MHSYHDDHKEFPGYGKAADYSCWDVMISRVDIMLKAEKR